MASLVTLLLLWALFMWAARKWIYHSPPIIPQIIEWLTPKDSDE